MEEVLYYLLKITVGTTVFYTAYHFLLRKNKKFVFNRFYLAGSFLAPFIIPFITFKTTSSPSVVSFYFSEDISHVADLEAFRYVAAAEKYMEVHELFLTIYLAGLIYCLLKLVYGYKVAADLQKRCTEKILNGIKIYVSQDNVRAFTFFDRIVIGKSILDHPSIDLVLSHESVHSKEKHFYDIIMAELLFIPQWFNPFARLHKQAIRNNLEFRADDIVISQSDIPRYLTTLLSMARHRVKPPLFAELNSSNLKKRIIMMKSKKQSRFANLARLALVPMCALLLVSLSGKEPTAINDDFYRDGKVHQAWDSGKGQSVAVSLDLSDPRSRHYIDVFVKKHNRILLRGKEVSLEDISAKILSEVENKKRSEKYRMTGLIKTYTETPLKQILYIKEIFNSHGIEDVIIDTVSYNKPTEMIIL